MLTTFRRSHSVALALVTLLAASGAVFAQPGDLPDVESPDQADIPAEDPAEDLGLPPVTDQAPEPVHEGDPEDVRPAPDSDPVVPVVDDTPATTVDGIPQLTAAEVAGAPRPDQATGIGRERASSSRIAAWPLRVILFPARAGWWLVSQPIRGGLYAYDRYQLGELFREIFFNDTGTFGVFPVADLYSDFGVTIGVRAIHRDLFGAEEGLSARAAYGGRFRQQYELEVDSGDRFGRVELGAGVGLRIQPNERFFGIGNRDIVEPTAVTMPVDPTQSMVAVETRFRQRVTRGVLGMEIGLGGPLSAELSSGLVHESFGDADDLRGDVQLASVYDPMTVVGFQDDLTYSYNELALRIDTRTAGYWLSNAAPNRGWFLSVFGGYAAVSGDAASDYVRYGADLQRLIPLWGDMRTLVLRAFTEAVTGDLDELPFTALPTLGGDQLLRGYDFDRFRDRVIGMVSAEYQIRIARTFSGFFFTDLGRPWRDWGDVTADELRLGFGAGLQAHTGNTFLLRAQIASSIDGGIFLNLSLDPTFDPREPLDEL